MKGIVRIDAAHSDKPWRRFAIALPLSTIIISTTLYFCSLLKPGVPARVVFNAIEVYLIQPPIQAAGLRSGAASAPAKPPTVKKVQRTIAPKAHRLKTHVPKARAAPELSASIAARPEPQASAAALTQPSSAAGQGTAAARATGAGASSGIGNGTAGALAIYAPLPKIPDELREEDFESVAVAHFRVLGDGAVTASLITPTRNPRLNEVLLETLRQWRFYPAKKGGVAVDSEFDVRIPISVQ